MLNKSYQMKTIKELEAEINLNKTFDVGYREALKDVLELIDEIYRDDERFRYPTKEELKKRITG